MKTFRADLHIHSVLSPCGDLEMSPINIVKRAAEVGLDMIAVCDHNTTLHGPLVRELAARYGITALLGAEVTTREEIHCLCLFDREEQRQSFQRFIERSIMRLPNNPDIFGYQVVVNEQEEIVDEIDYLLHAALSKGVEEVADYVHSLGGLFIPAHVDRPKYSLISQLGFIPPTLRYDALEISYHTTPGMFIGSHPLAKESIFIRGSDAHFIHQLGEHYTRFTMAEPSFECLRRLLSGNKGKAVTL